MTVRITGLALVFACLLAVPSSADAARGMRVAVQDDSTLLFRAGEYIPIDTAYRRIRAMRASLVRMNILWGYTVTDSQRRLKSKPRNVAYDWAPYDRAITNARQRGMKVLLTLTGPGPAWATPKNRLSKGYFKPNVRYFKQFVKAAVRRYRGQVKLYSIWNEPNWHKWLSPLRQGPMRYRKLYQAGYRTIKRQAPRARVLLGETSPNAQPGIATAPLKFLRKMTCLKGNYRKKRSARRRCRSPLRADGVAHHPYDFTHSPWTNPRGRDDVTIANLGRLNRALKKMRRRRALIPRRTRKMPVHLTEFGYHRSGYRKVPERRRARWEVAAFKIARKNPRVQTMLHYVFVRPPGERFFDLSLLDTDGSTTRTYRKLSGWGRHAARKRQIARPARWRAG
ncbi:MAG: cellulase family glycosylhydrolase [Thermoleophilaceae bacterium]